MVWTAGQDLTAALLNANAPQEWTAYTPSWTASSVNPALGNGTISGRYVQHGDLVHFEIVVTAGSTTTFGTGSYSLTLPVAIRSGGFIINASVQYIDGGTLYYGGATFLASGTTFRIGVVGAAGAQITSATPTSPFTWASTDQILVAGAYERA